MILSHKYRFIFLKTGKTAGTSTEIALSAHCGPDDIITPIGEEDEDIRRQLGYPGPQNYLASPLAYRFRDLVALATQRELKMAFYNHVPAFRVRRLIGDRIWRDYYKFCIVRNPWERVISSYYWHTRDTRPRPSVRDFLRDGGAVGMQRRGFQVYTIAGEVAVDKVCRFETLAGDLEDVRRRLGIPEPLNLPRAKEGSRSDRRSYREILDKEEIDEIRRLFADEFELFGYDRVDAA